ncbi:MAG: peroxiredoxin [Immundisolibacter sp.]|uniref:peroxiredoxin n=1 Tax=Immundisolibacter sp. TaxID=1934948 RepID=UPI0019CA8A09|nr:peroxiredoxin [Immundisolibacter sp.]MBC7162863.1 peroxiredoxin [Immundisolibacter sp.]
MPEPIIGAPAPDFSLPATGNRTISLADLRGQAVVLYFYPKDSTPGCTQEGQEFQQLFGEFAALGAVILGVSRDSVASHEKFRARHGFSFDLLSDAQETACRAYDVIREKNMYGKTVLGIERSTFLIDADGVLREAWRKVKVKDHAAAVLERLKAL